FFVVPSPYSSFFSRTARPLTSPLFPYTTLFRSELEADIHSFTSTGNETDVQAIMQQIETVMNKAKGSTGEARFEGFEGVSSIKADRKSTRLNSSHVSISYAVFCLKKKITFNTVQ